MSKLEKKNVTFVGQLTAVEEKNKRLDRTSCHDKRSFDEKFN
jgi:hypothetical protein